MAGKTAVQAQAQAPVLLGDAEPIKEAVDEFAHRAESILSEATTRARELGRQEGLLEAGEPWVALFFCVVGAVVGFVAGLHFAG